MVEIVLRLPIRWGSSEKVIMSRDWVIDIRRWWFCSSICLLNWLFSFCLICMLNWLSSSVLCTLNGKIGDTSVLPILSYLNVLSSFILLFLFGLFTYSFSDWAHFLFLYAPLLSLPILRWVGLLLGSEIPAFWPRFFRFWCSDWIKKRKEQTVLNDLWWVLHE